MGQKSAPAKKMVVVVSIQPEAADCRRGCIKTAGWNKKSVVVGTLLADD